MQEHTKIIDYLTSPIDTLPAVTKEVHAALKRIGCDRVIDLLLHLPSNIVFKSFAPDLTRVVDGTTVVVPVTVLSLHVNRRSRVNRVVCSDGKHLVELMFFQTIHPYVLKSLQVDNKLVVEGKLSRDPNGSFRLVHPRISSSGGYVSEVDVIYPETYDLHSYKIRRLVHTILKHISDTEIPEWLSASVMKQHQWGSWLDSIRALHNPKSMRDLSPHSPHRLRLAFDELVASQLALQHVRQTSGQVGNPLCFPGNLASKLIDASGFTLTDGQLKAIAEIASDQRSNKRMLRLLQGDVGSGKTIVAACAVLNAIEAGKQAAIVAPTDLLASQHFGYITSLCQSLEGVRIEILTGKTTSSKRRTILKDLSEGKINLVIGTHAVFQHDVIFKDLGLVVIDEQHRFGVEQRMALINKGDKADVLAMSATPIPRTLSLAIYKDMHVSILQDKPYSNSSITTYTKLDSKIEEVLAFMKAKLDLSEQIYWVCPLIEHDEESSDTSAKIRFEHLKKVFGDSVGLLHGKLLQKEKDVIMSEFVEGKLSVLVATTVIEVGIDVKNATLMVIEQAERFGLAQLHQLRGRVGRSSKPSTCILLFSRNIGEIARQRLEIIKKSNNGFLIAEQDFKLRGGGEILGTKQSGLPEFRVASLDLHYDLLLEASQYADQERIDERTSVLLRLFGYDAAARLVHAS